MKLRTKILLIAAAVLLTAGSLAYAQSGDPGGALDGGRAWCGRPRGASGPGGCGDGDGGYDDRYDRGRDSGGGYDCH